jgi:adenylyltransferase/sulfurtransferase
MYLSSAGVGRVDVCDPDAVDLSNLHRQILHSHVGEDKAASASGWIRKRGSRCEWSTQKLQDVGEFSPISQSERADYDLVLDCTDRWSSHRDVIMSSMSAGKTVVHGSIAGLLGRVMTFGPGSPCWLCLHPEKPEAAAKLVRGTLGPVCGVVGSTMAMEAVRILLGMPPGLLGRMMTFDALSMSVSKFEMSKLDGCPGCA